MNPKLLLPTLAACSLGLTGLTSAQGSDQCTTAQAITGLGFFNFDNSAATTDGLPDPLCDYFSQSDVENDVWFSWVAPSSSIYTFETCGLTTVDTKAGIYDGSCAGTLLACNDDSCSSLQTSITWSATAGSTYLIRLGTYPTALGGVGQFELREEIPASNPGNGNSYMVVTAGLSWQDADTSAQSYTYGGSPGHLVTISDQAELDWILANLVVDRPWIGLYQDTGNPNYSEPSGGWVWVTGEPRVFTNWFPGEPNDNSATAGPENYCEMFASGEWNDAELNHLQTNSYIIEFEGSSSGNAYCAGDGSATCPCFAIFGPGVGCQNTGGPGAGLAGTGNAQVSNDTFQFDVSGVPGAKPGLLVKGSVQIFNAVGDGILCTAPQMRSHVQITSAAGEATYADFDSQPFGAIANMGSPTYFQYWYRDPGNTCGGGFNFSNAWEVSFTP